MSERRSFSVQVPAKTASRPGTSFPLGAHGLDGLPEWGSLSTELKELIRLAGEAPSSFRLRDYRHNEPITLAQLEMLEAELGNQGLVPQLSLNSPTIAQAAGYESTLLQWRARRMGSKTGEELQFLVNLPTYIGYLGAEILLLLRDKNVSASATYGGQLSSHRLSWRAIFPSEESLISTLNYLDRFAVYLSSTDEENQNRYTRGLNLVLRIIAERRPSGNEKRATAAAIADNQIALPTTSDEFIAALRK